jgi:uncharacterized lipoprotein YddW (UPF0748 family)
MKKIIFFITCFVSCYYAKAQENLPLDIKGTWITNVASEAMYNPENVRKTVMNCKNNGLTDIFVVVWNGGVTMYPSKVLNLYIGKAQSELFKGFDPLKAFVEEGHKLGLRVHAWFEFGASYAYKDSSANGWLEKYPSWAGKNSSGALLKKNGFFWWNTINPEVQTFLKKMVLEVVKNYEVDGVQGDDRLPAMPSEGGYDAYTTKRYAKEFSKKQMPLNPKEPAFLQWKADKVSDFGKQIYLAVKKTRSTCIVSWAPSIYPWSKEQYLQDWPKWLNEGYADYIIPQLYRYKIGDYERILKELSSQVPPTLKHKIFPGILTSLGDGYRVDQNMFNQMIALNRQFGFKGEVFFYYETLNQPLVK